LFCLFLIYLLGVFPPAEENKTLRRKRDRGRLVS